MAVLLSIKPKYVNEIINESKKYEFRKSIFKRNNVSKAYIYSTNPVKKLIGKFTPPQSFYYIDEDIFKIYFNIKNGPEEKFGQYRLSSK